MIAQPQQAAMPPKLQQLLSTMPDVDKVNLLALAHHYRMDLDDPGFLPLLLTREGIAALDKAKTGLVQEVERTTGYVLGQIDEAINQRIEQENTRLEKCTVELVGHLKSESTASEVAAKVELATWTNDTLKNVVEPALIASAKTAAAIAASESIEKLSIAATAVTQQCQAAAQAARDAAASAESAAQGTNWIMIFAVFACGVLIGAVSLYLMTN